MKYITLMLAILIVLAACTSSKTTETETTGPVEVQTETTEEAQTETTEQQEIIQEEKQLAEQIKEEITTPAQTRTRMYKYLDLFAEVTGYEFTYKGSKYFVKDKKYKIQLNAPQTANEVKFGDIEKRQFYYDTVYVDRVSKTAIAYCEGNTAKVNKQCAQLELYDLAYPVGFYDYDILLPEDWLFQNLDKEPSLIEENKYYIKGRGTIFLKFEQTPELELNIDPSSGLVIRADQKKGNMLLTRNDYENLVTNTVRDIDVNHRSKSEIPTEETFYRQI